MLQKNCKLIIIVLTLLSVFFLAIIFNLYLENKNLKNPEASAEKEIKSLIAKLGKLMSLPENELPTIATVTDPEKLKNQPFFINSKVGDKVIVYELNKKVILFRPSENKIIEVSVFNTNEEQTVSNQ